MNVLFDHTVFVVHRYGGISRYFSELIPRVAEQDGVDVSVFMGFYLNEYGLERQRDKFAHFFGVRRPAVRRTHRLAMRAANALLPRFARRCRPDVYHATAYGAPRYSGPRCGVPGKRVVTIHDMTAEKLPHLFPEEEARGEEKKRLAREADGVVCISEATRRDVVELLNIPRDRTVVVHHANSLDVTPGEERLVERRYVLFVGMRAAYKNFEKLVEAVATGRKLPKDLHIACFGGGDFTAAERQRFADLGISGRFHHFAGGDETLATLYAHADAFVYPSLYEGFGIPLLEAMHYGCPVLASKIDCFLEVAADAVLYFNPASADDLADQLARLLDDSQLREKLITAGRACEKIFSWDRCARETTAFYRSLCTPTPPIPHPPVALSHP
jgi:glycosyltransferase involved in cell wall biosynthesis